VDQARGEQAMIRLLRRERGRLRGDREAVAAVERGLVRRVKHFGWHYLDTGRPGAAVRVLVRGFLVTRRPGLLARAVAALLPRRPARGEVRSGARGDAARPARRATG
jgi:hypothetical protein